MITSHGRTTPRWVRNDGGTRASSWPAPHFRHSIETSSPSLLSSHHVDCLKPSCEIAAFAAESSRRSAAVISALKVPSAGRIGWILTWRYDLPVPVAEGERQVLGSQAMGMRSGGPRGRSTHLGRAATASPRGTGGIARPSTP